MSEPEIRLMEEADLAEVAAIEREAIAPPWSEEAFRESLGLPHTILLTAVKDGQIAGYCVCYQSFEEGEITNVAVKKELRGQGIAGKLLEKLCSYGRERGLERYILEVRAGNEPAIHLYERSGFTRVGIRKGFYEQPVEDAVIMTKG